MCTLLDVSDFVPHPLLRGGHVQTIATRFFRPAPPPAERLEVRLPDGDTLVAMISYPPGWKQGDPIVLLVHGLSGSSRSGYLVRMARLSLARGLAAVRINLRNAGEGAGLAQRPYHSGRSEDIRAILGEVARRHPQSSLGLIGYSLGGNITLKLAGELHEHPVPALQAVAAVAAPIDLSLAADALARRENILYETYFIRALIADARVQSRMAGLPLPDFGRRPTIRTFDDRYTAPRSGFAGAEDYYARASSGPLLAHVPIPTLLISAQDDPFVPFSMYRDARFSSLVETDFPRFGGHCAFIGSGFPNVRFWAEERAVGFVAERLG